MGHSGAVKKGLAPMRSPRTGAWNSLVETELRCQSVVKVPALTRVVFFDFWGRAACLELAARPLSVYGC